MQDKKEKLLNTLAKVIKKHRGHHSITQLAYEINVSKSIWSLIEKGNRDVQLTTLWKIAEALYMKPSDLINNLEQELGENFSFIEEAE